MGRTKLVRPLFTAHTPMTLIIDAHQDLAHNMVTQGRDYTRSVLETRRIEQSAGEAHQHAGVSLLGWPEYQTGEVGVIFSTLFSAPLRSQSEGWDNNVYANFEQAHDMYWKQLEIYHRLVDDHPDQFRQIFTQADLNEVLLPWQKPAAAPNPGDQTVGMGKPVGLVVLMEGAEGVRSPAELQEWWQGGVRLIGLAWAGTRYCGGTREPGPLTTEGRELLGAMADLGFTLDLSHMDILAAMQALDEYTGPIVVSHGNPLTMLKGSDSNRHLPDREVDGVIARGGVIGIVPYNKFLRAGWTETDGKAAVTLNDVAAHIDYICQRAGDARHVGFGSDFDGGFGRESVPAEIETIADLQKLAPILLEKGYSEEDVQAIFGGNWLAHLQRTLPA